MTLRESQVGFFRTFGYLKLGGLLADSIDWIIPEFEDVMNAHLQQYPHDGSQRTLKWQFIDSTQRLCTLLDDDRIVGPLASLLGKDFIYTGSSGNLYAGNTGWHTDDFHSHERVKIAVYLDPLTAQTGALRVIPCTHKINDDVRDLQLQLGQSVKLLGIRGNEVPAVVLDVIPGDVVLFDQNILHSSWGGSSRRRMFSINAHRRYAKHELHVLKSYIGELARFWCERVHGEIMRSTAPPERMTHLDQVIDNEGHLIELSLKARIQTAAPSRDNNEDFSENDSPSRARELYAHNAIFETDVPQEMQPRRI